MNLEAIVNNYPYRKNLPKEDIVRGWYLYIFIFKTEKSGAVNYGYILLNH